MYTEIRLVENGRYPSLEFNIPLLTWNDWMQDNISLLPAVTENNNEVVLFSFHNGNVLARGRTTPEQFQRLFDSSCVCLAAISIGEKPLIETTIFKKEHFDTGGHFFQGVYHQTSGDFDSAILAYEKALKANPQLYRAHNLLGLCHRISGNNEAAEKSYLASIDICSTCPEAQSNLGTLYLKTGREVEAEAMFLKALEADEFYLNALLKLSKLYLKRRKVLDSDFFQINLKLFKLYSSIPKVISRLEDTAQLGQMSLNEYCQRLGSSNSYLNSDQIIRQMKGIEGYINNGALFAAINGLKKLGNESEQTYHGHEILGWCRQRFEKIKATAADLKHLELSNAVSAIKAAVPALKSNEKSVSPLNSTEFFSLVILEIMRDGQIDLHEKKIVQKLRDMLQISDQDYHDIINRIRSQVSANPFFEKEPKGFQPLRLFRSLVRAAARDRVIEESEKKILVFASKAFGISSDDVHRILAEVTP